MVKDNNFTKIRNKTEMFTFNPSIKHDIGDSTIKQRKEAKYTQTGEEK